MPHIAAFAELDPSTLYALLRLRVDVFVVEQNCPYPELDGRDLEPATRHIWIAGNEDRTSATQADANQADGIPLAYLRVLDGPDGARIGRVCVAASARGRGHAAALMRAALDLVADRPCALNAQSYLTGFYRRFGFAPSGPEFLDDGVPHTPMIRPVPAAR